MTDSSRVEHSWRPLFKEGRNVQQLVGLGSGDGFLQSVVHKSPPVSAPSNALYTAAREGAGMEPS